ncbi:hypothetical protein [Mariniluteicoccus endophyticus]
MATLVVAAPLSLLQERLGVEWWVVDLPALAPAVAAAVTLALCRPLRLTVDWRPGVRPTPQALGRTLVLAALGAGVVLGCVQFSATMRWPREAVDLGTLAYPLAMPGDRSTILCMMALTLLITCTAQELGWRSLVQPTLGEAYAPVVSGTVTGAAWALTQPLLAARVLERWGVRHSAAEVVLYVAAFVVAHVAMSVLLACVQQDMEQGRLLSAVAFRWVVAMGLFLMLDEEAGRWQPMGAIALVTMVFAASTMAYRWYTGRVLRSTR